MVKDNENLKDYSKEELIEIIEKKRLKEEEQEKFLLNISHDLRSPLNVIMSINQILEQNKKDVITQKEKEYLNMLKRNSYKILKLIDNLIDVTKLENNYFKIKKKNIEVVSFIESTINSIDKYAKQKEITLIFDTNKEECVIAVDPEALDRICINLISNAIKFSHKGGHVYTILMIDNNIVKMSIIDDGIGISDEDQKYVFNRFAQVDHLNSNEFKGSGIGLELVKSLVELHDGKVFLESKLGKGSNFTIILPKIGLNKDEKEIITDDSRVEMLEIEFSDIYL